MSSNTDISMADVGKVLRSDAVTAAGVLTTGLQDALREKHTDFYTSASERRTSLLGTHRKGSELARDSSYMNETFVETATADYEKPEPAPLPTQTFS